MSLEAENAELKIKLALLAEQVQLLQANLVAQQQLNALLTEQNKQLQAQLAKDSHNSSKPPSSDGFKRSPKKRSLKKASGKKSGGQAGHTGHALVQVENPDYRVEHLPGECQHCHNNLRQLKVVPVARRQVFELPSLKLEVTEHTVYACLCPHCHTPNLGAFPPEVRNWVQYGPRLRALVVYLHHYQLMPYARLTEILAELFGQSLSQGSLANLLEECYQRLEEPEQAIKLALSQREVAHFDETGGRVEGKLHWFHVISSATLTYYAVHPKRGKAATEAIGVLGAFKGTAVHDGLSSYAHYPCQHALCNAHHLRELTFVEEQGGQSWAGEMKVLLLNLKEQVTEAQAAGSNCLPPAVLVQAELAYQKLLLVGLGANPPPPSGWPKGKRGRIKQTKTKNLLDRLQAHQAEVLAFAYDFKVPFDNNQAERDLRMLKVQQKVSGCFRSDEGAAWFCRIRGYISTMRKQGQNAFKTLYLVFKGQPLLPVWPE